MFSSSYLLCRPQIILKTLPEFKHPQIYVAFVSVRTDAPSKCRRKSKGHRFQAILSIRSD